MTHRWAAVLALLVAACAPTSVRPPADTDEPTPRPASPTVAPIPRPGATPTGAPTPAPSPATILPVPDGTARPAWAAQVSGTIHFRRDGALWRASVASGSTVKLVDQAGDFAVAPDGQRVAVVTTGAAMRSAENADERPDIWVVPSTPAVPVRVTTDARVEVGLTWSSNGALAFASVNRIAFAPTSASPAYSWADTCRSAEVQVWTSGLGIRSIGPGCDPAWSPDGTKLAYASPPEVGPTTNDPQPRVNAIRVADAQGSGTTDVLRIGGARPAPFGTDPTWPGRYLVHPVWLGASDLVYGRFVGYSSLCDHLTVERMAVTGGTPELLSAVDWMERSPLSPSGRYLAIDAPACNAAGFGGYNTRGIDLLDITQTGTAWDPPIFGSPPSFLIPTAARSVLSGVRAHSPTWSPTADVLAYVYPPNFPGSREVTPERTSRYNGTDPGDVIVRDVGRGEAFRLIGGVDFGSPLVWSR